MIERKTVIVLGAGASAAYGFPTGDGLQRQIYAIGNSSQSVEGVENVLQQFGYTAQDYRNFRDAVQKARRLTIDAFLSEQPERTQHLGKILVAYRLIHCEQDVHLYQRVEEDWYHYFYNRVMKPGFEAFDQNKLSIVTYNYDRSLEQWFWGALTTGGHRSVDECREKFVKVPVLHLHGKMGNLPPFGFPSRSYSTSLSREEVQVAVDGIQVVHEVDDTIPVFRQAREEISSARVVVFLGFSYDPVNVRRLLSSLPGATYDDGGQLMGEKKFWGTAYGLTAAEARDVSALFYRVGGIELTDLRILPFLQRSSELFRG